MRIGVERMTGKSLEDGSKPRDISRIYYKLLYIYTYIEKKAQISGSLLQVAESLAESGSVMSYTEEFDATMTSKSEAESVRKCFVIRIQSRRVASVASVASGVWCWCQVLDEAQRGSSVEALSIRRE